MKSLAAAETNPTLRVSAVATPRCTILNIRIRLIMFIAIARDATGTGEDDGIGNRASHGSYGRR